MGLLRHQPKRCITETRLFYLLPQDILEQIFKHYFHALKKRAKIQFTPYCTLEYEDGRRLTVFKKRIYSLKSTLDTTWLRFDTKGRILTYNKVKSEFILDSSIVYDSKEDSFLVGDQTWRLPYIIHDTEESPSYKRSGFIIRCLSRRLLSRCRRDKTLPSPIRFRRLLPYYLPRNSRLRQV